MRQVRIARHPKHHYEIHRFCQRANEAQKAIGFSHPRLSAADEKWLARKKVTAEEALERALQIRRGCGLAPGDLFILTLDGNIVDAEVFAIRDIPKGSPVFGDDEAPVTLVPVAVVKRLRSEVRALYEDFCVLHENHYVCPASFNLLTPAWYLNHSATPNVACDASLRFFALRRIRKGEELTADYRTYSADPAPTGC